MAAFEKKRQSLKFTADNENPLLILSVLLLFGKKDISNKSVLFSKATPR